MCSFHRFASGLVGCALAFFALCLSVFVVRAADPPGQRARKVVLLAGTVHQGPGGHPAGTHEYELSVRLLKHALETATNSGPIKAEVHCDGWPRDPRTLEDADTIVVISDGSDRNEADHPLLVGDRLETLKRQMQRGCGLVAIHWTVFVPQNRGGPEFLEWIGGYFDYQSGGVPNKWFSKIQATTASPRPATPQHPICRGLTPFELREEYYYNIRFREGDKRLTPILNTALPGEAAEQTVAWAVERGDGGRGFGFTGGHFFDNWGVENFRRMVLNAIVWTAHGEVPDGGVQTQAPTIVDTSPAADDKPIQAVIVTGHQHPAHVWRDTTVALQEALSQDRRFQITVVTDPEFLASKNLSSYDVVLFNYCNWQRGPLSDAAKAGFAKYLADGGGLVLIHFANGAFHASLPETPNSDWPEYRNICRRVWDHAPGRSSHDPYGHFRVNVVRDHPITLGMNSFETIDELYCNQQGDAPIEVLATAHSTVTGKDEPLAFVYPYGQGRVFQTVLGHADESIRTPGTAALIRRGATWAAGSPQRAVATQSQAAAPTAPKLASQGRFVAALDPRQGPAWAPRLENYDRLPLSVECWAKLNGKAGFNILVANNSKESGDHWELYSYAGAGDFSLYLPGCSPAEIRSGVDIADGQWHFVAAAFDDMQARLFVDGKLAKEVKLSRQHHGGPLAPLYFGGYPPHNIGCDGLVDEVRISSGLRDFDLLPDAAPEADSQTLGLWHFDRLDRDQVEDASKTRNSALGGGRTNAAAPLLARRPADSELKLISLDTSPDESFLSMRADTLGRLFVGGREALFVYEPADQGGYQPRQLLYRFPPDTWVTDVEIRGDDLYVMTNAALYLIPRGRVDRENLNPQRLLWGSPVDLHVTWHGLAWGPEGDLYFSSGDPLLNYGDFQNRPDHWGHWTIYTQPEGTKVPYTGVGGFFRCRPDGTNLRVVAEGARGAVGMAFDRRWNLFSNDNDHESIAERYSPARLLHVAPHAHFFWPRGWIASMSPERSDLLEIVNTGMGREAPVGQAYYDEPLLNDKLGDCLLVACWGQRKVEAFPLRKRGASFSADAFPLVVGTETARPLGVAVGRGGRVFVALSYMAANEWSPKYPSELVMLTRADDPATCPFEPYDAPTASAERLWAELSQPSCQRRQQAQVEILRRGGTLLVEAIERMRTSQPHDPARMHLPWLAAASGRVEARQALVAWATSDDALVRQQALRALAEFRELGAPAAVFAQAIADTEPQIQLAAVTALIDRDDPLNDSLADAIVHGPARGEDTYLRQASAFLLAGRASHEQLRKTADSSDPAIRLAGVLAAGFRLTVPPAIGPVAENLPLRYESENALFTIQYADATINLKQLARLGSFTTAERWKTIPHSPSEGQLFELLLGRLDDTDDRVRNQACYFLNLLDDSRANSLVAAAQRKALIRKLDAAAKLPLAQAWLLGPLADGASGFDQAHPPEQGALDLAQGVTSGEQKFEWQPAGGEAGFTLSGSEEPASSYLYFRLHSLDPQPVGLLIPPGLTMKIWHNGRPVAGADPLVLALDAGSNDILVRVAHGRQPSMFSLTLQTPQRVEATLPEKLALGTLAERLKNVGDSGTISIAPEFLATDWQRAAETGNAERGRKLFGTDALGCAKCHAILPNQKGGGAPSLAGAARRFTVSHVVESVLLPSKQVAPVFGTTTVVTSDGRNVSGLAVEENDRELVLLLPTAARQSIAKSDIEARKLQPLSPMPNGLVKTPAELADLLAYLMSANPQAP